MNIPFAICSCFLVTQAVPSVKYRMEKDSPCKIELARRPIQKIFVSKDGSQLVASCFGDHFFFLRAYDGGFEVASQMDLEPNVRAVSFGDLSPKVAYCGQDDSKIVICQLEHNDLRPIALVPMGNRPRNRSSYIAMALSPSSRILIRASRADGGLDISTSPSYLQNSRLKDSESETAYLFHFSPDESFVASAHHEETVAIWNLSSTKKVASLPHPKHGPVVGMAFSKDNKRISVAYGYKSGWDIGFSETEISTGVARNWYFTIPDDAKVKHAVFSGDLGLAYTCDNKGRVFQFNLIKKEQRKLFEEGNGCFSSIGLLSECHRVAVSSWGGAVYLIPLTARGD